MYKHKRTRKRFIAGFYVMLLSIATFINLTIPKIDAIAENEYSVIPKEAIRLRILANSDSEKDQNLKREIRDAINQEITNWVEHLTSLEEARTLIRNRLPDIQEIAEQIIAKHQLHQSVKVEFGSVQFPTKLYGEFLYPAGTYEAILVTLGKGQGANWWCVLFPPLCFLDFSNGVAVSEGFEDENNEEKEQQQTTHFVEEKDEPVKVKFFLIELFKKIFS